MDIHDRTVPDSEDLSPYASGTPIHLVVLTGAGVSADSGVRTFRDAGGLWEGRDVMEVATPEGWERDPELVWRFYQARRQQLAEVEPNSAHVALAEMETRMCAAGQVFTLISQNVDDLHQRAGSTVLDMHGQLLRLACQDCGSRMVDREHFDEGAFVPCSVCGLARLRPDVVWFGETPAHLDAIDSAMQSCTHFFSVGTSGSVYPAAGLLAIARSVEAETFVNSLEEPDNLAPTDTFLAGRAADVVPSQLERWAREWIGEGEA